MYQITGKSVQFHHLHGTGIKAIMMDMDPKQMSGMYTTYVLQESLQIPAAADLSYPFKRFGASTVLQLCTL